MSLPPYRAPIWLRNPHIQSVFASSRLRRLGQTRHLKQVDAAAEDHILDCGEGVRLHGRYTAQTSRDRARGLVVLFHGWEGSVQSSYLLRTGAQLLSQGFDVFRLNFRDHGDTHHLNPGIFHSCRIAEVVGAVAAIEKLWGPPFLAVAGFSLGGNFALRVALRAPAAGIRLDHAIAICPVLSPRRGLQAMESAPWFYQHYFMMKWRASLRRKQKAFPDSLDLSVLDGLGVRELTRQLVESHSEFATLDEYLDGYAVAGDRLSSLRVPVSILTAADDPIIPVADFRELRLPQSARLDIAEHGGHCGFLLDVRLNGYAERYVVERLLQAVTMDERQQTHSA